MSGAFGPAAIPEVYEVPYGPCNAIGSYIDPIFEERRSEIAKVLIRADISDVLRWFEAVDCKPSKNEADGRLAEPDELRSLISTAAEHVIAQSQIPVAEYTGPTPIDRDQLVKGLTEISEILANAKYPVRIKDTPPENL